MTPAPANFDPLARTYRLLEFVAFGRDLERTRFCLLDRLRDCREILVLGEGDGRCLARLVRLAPAANLHCVDASGSMLAAAARRLREPAARSRVTFTQAAVFEFAPPPGRYDAVVTLFFLDCFTSPEVAAIVARLLPALRPDARWLFADFVVPPAGWRRLRARLWLGVLYAYFGWQTGLTTRALPDSERQIARAGFRPEATRERQHGLLRTTLFCREDA